MRTIKNLAEYLNNTINPALAAIGHPRYLKAEAKLQGSAAINVHKVVDDRCIHTLLFHHDEDMHHYEAAAYLADAKIEELERKLAALKNAEKPTEVSAGEEARRAEIVARAKAAMEREGETEIDENAQISEGDDNGCYVQAWLWFDFTNTEFDKNNENEEDED